MAARNDERLYAKARSLFISRATMDDFAGWATLFMFNGFKTG